MTQRTVTVRVGEKDTSPARASAPTILRKPLVVLPDLAEHPEFLAPLCQDSDPRYLCLRFLRQPSPFAPLVSYSWSLVVFKCWG